MPASIFLVPGVGAQGGRVEDLGPALGGHPASLLVTASRSIADADDPAAAADRLRTAVWDLAA
jgi:orotidine-5'-phosphate decarboxylase